MVDAQGELIGINTFIITNNGSFAWRRVCDSVADCSVNRRAADCAWQKVEHGYLGISMNDVTPANAHFFNLQNATGAIVAQVTPDSPASRGGVKQGDVISELNGRKIVFNASALQVAVSEDDAGNQDRAGRGARTARRRRVNLTVGEFQGKSEVASNDGPGMNQAASKPASSDSRSAI